MRMHYTSYPRYQLAVEQGWGGFTKKSLERGRETGAREAWHLFTTGCEANRSPASAEGAFLFPVRTGSLCSWSQTLSLSCANGELM